MSGAFSATAPRMTMEELKQEWAKLSEVEQQAALSDLYGQPSGSSIAENPNVLKCALEKLEKQLNLIKYKPAFENALRECPSYLKSDQFRLMFLRAENFDEQVCRLFRLSVPCTRLITTSYTCKVINH